MESRDRDEALREHRQALVDFIAAARGVGDEAWNAPRAAGKWSPAQVAEHLRLTYVMLRAELAGKGGFRVRSKWWQRPLFRLLFASRILRTGRFPQGAPAVREVRPGDGPFDRHELLERLQGEGERFLADMGSPSVRALSHPFFGKMPLDKSLRLATRHLRHHEVQVATPAAAVDVLDEAEAANAP
jgi:hypothetical protein